MAANMMGMRVERATVIGAQPLPPSPATYRENHRGSHRQRLGACGLVAAILLALLIGSVALRDRQETRPVASVTEHVNKAERQLALAPTGSVALVTEHINKAERQFAVAPTGPAASVTEHTNKAEMPYAVAPHMENVTLIDPDR